MRQKGFTPLVIVFFVCLFLLLGLIIGNKQNNRNVNIEIKSSLQQSLSPTPQPTANVVVRTPIPTTISGNSIKIEVTDQESTHYLKTFSFDKQQDDHLSLIPGYQNNLYRGIIIERSGTKLTVIPAFEGNGKTYEQIPDYVVINNSSLSSSSSISRILENNSYLYVTRMDTKDCSAWHPHPAACSESNLNGTEVYCEANLETVKYCDELVRTLRIQTSKVAN